MTAEFPDVHVFLLAGPVPGGGHAEALAAAVRHAETAERIGLAGVWFAEHHFIRYGAVPSATVMAAHILGRTRRITVGTAACVLSTRHPVALAEEAAMLDELGGGRFALGVGRGGPWVDLEVFGTGAPRYEHGFAESLDLARSWLSGADQVGADGEHVRFRPVRVVPRPRRPVPLWVAATSPATVDLAAERGLPVLLGLHEDDAARAALLRRWATTAARQGHTGAPHATALLAVAGRTTEAAVAQARAGLPRLLEGTRDYVRLDGSARPPQDLAAYAEHLIDVGAVGTPAECRDRIAACAAATGVRHVLLMVEAAGDPEQVTDVLERLAAACVPS